MIPRALGVIGSGQMGGGIAVLAAMHGIPVTVCDVSQDALERGRNSMVKSLQRLVKSGRCSQDAADESMSRIQTSIDYQDLTNVDFAVEAATEDERLKRSIFRQLHEVCPAHAVLASNTSSLSITRLAASTGRPEKVVGMHFMNPPVLMQLIEVIKGMATSEETFAATMALSKHLGKTTCVSEDRPGFIVNRILMPMINEAFFTLMEGVSSAEDIDTGMKLGTNQPMGPLTLADFIGLDTCLAIMRVLHEGLGESKYRPCPLLVQYVDAGWFGRKSGRGVYKY